MLKEGLRQLMSARLWAFISMICWGIGPVMAKLALPNLDPFVGLCVRTVIAAVMVSCGVVFLFRRKFYHIFRLRDIILLICEAILVSVAGDFLYYRAINQGTCIQTSIILSSSPIVTIGLSAFFFKEKMSVTSLLGVLSITIGLVLISSTG